MDELSSELLRVLKVYLLNNHLHRIKPDLVRLSILWEHYNLY